MENIRIRGSLLFAVLALLLLAPLATLASASQTSDLTLVVSLSDFAEGEEWHTDVADLQISISVHNPSGDAIELEYNPSCPVEITMLDSSGLLLTSLRDHRACQEQSRAINIPAQQTRTLDTFEWDWTDIDANIVNSGVISLQFDFDEGTLSHEELVQFQRSPVSIDGIALEMTVPPPAGQHLTYQTGESVYSHLSLRNTGGQSVVVDVDEGCKVRVQLTGMEGPLAPRLSELGCAAGTTIPAGGSTPLGWLVWDFTDDGEIMLPGDWDIEVSLTGVAGPSAGAQVAWDPSLDLTPTTLDLEMSIIGDSGDDAVISAADTVQLITRLSNDGSDTVELEFRFDCLAMMRVISADGNVVYDDWETRSCSDSLTENKVESGEVFVVDQRLWDFTDSYGCELDDGPHMLVVTVPEEGKTVEWEFEYEGFGGGIACRAEMQDTSMTQFSVESLRVLDPGTNDERLTFDLRLNTMNGLDLYWPQQCRLQFSLTNLGDSQPHRLWNEACEDEGGVLQSVSPNEHIMFGPFTIEFDGLEAGSWTLVATTTGTPEFTTQWARVWSPPAQQGEDEQQSTAEEDDGDIDESVDTPVESWVAEGSWKYVTTDMGGCWLLVDLAGDEHALASTTLPEWQPVPHLQGSYWVKQSAAAEPACAGWDSKIMVSEVMAEQVVEPVVEGETSEANAEPVIIPIPATAPAVIATIATTGIFALLISMVTQVEWIRMPATKWGLAIIGMVKRNPDKGGEYQRGRIVAYIELHSGIHFRALLGALGMSNGQLTHHLSVLHNDERIWKRKDGRKVRFYPTSIDSGTAEEDLPVPVLTPDPNSLQGRILQMLDIHENDILNLSQKELAIKLETSQQLVSYHLKSLEQWGLVEKEKVALRFRYRLTDRALLLMDNNEFPTLGDDL